MKKSYLLIIMLLFIFPITVSAATVNADGNWHKVVGTTIKLSSSDDEAKCKINGDVYGAEVRAVKNGSNYNCEIKSSSITDVTVDYGYVAASENTYYSQGTTSVNLKKFESVGETTSEKETTEVLPFCKDSSVKVGFKIVGIVIMIVKIFVPIALIVLGMLDMSKAVVSDKQDAVKSSAITFAKRAIAALLVFLAPTIVFNLFEALGLWADSFKEDFSPCYTCLLKPNECEGASLIKDINKE